MRNKKQLKAFWSIGRVFILYMRTTAKTKSRRVSTERQQRIKPRIINTFHYTPIDQNRQFECEVYSPTVQNQEMLSEQKKCFMANQLVIELLERKCNSVLVWFV